MATLADAHSARPRAGRWVRYLRGDVVIAYLLLVACLVAGWLSSPYFLTGRNIADLLAQAATLGMVGIGETLVILIGGIDLSVGSLISLTTTVASYVIVSDATGNILVGAALCLVIGAASGLINGLGIAFLRIPDFMMTLAMMAALQGAALFLRPAPDGLISNTFSNALTAQIGPLPVLALVVLFVAIATQVLLRVTPFGLHLYAIGSYRESARLAGIGIKRVRIGAYVLCGIAAALAGLLFSARIGTGDPLSGQPFALTAVTAVVIGGSSLFGGRGSAAMTIAGALILTCIGNVLTLMQVSSYYQYVITGVLLIAAVWLYTYLPIRR